MLSCQEYGTGVDTWAVGCIFAELLGQKPLFPGDDYIHQLKLIVEVLGSPSDDDMSFVRSSRARAFMAKQAGKPKIPWATLFPKANAAGLDLLDKLLTFNPSKRISVDAALEHPYLESLHCPEDEPVCPKRFDFSFEHHPLTKRNLQLLMFEQIGKYHPDALDRETRLGNYVPLGAPPAAQHHSSSGKEGHSTSTASGQPGTAAAK
jgi:serine/threonine protein kinase